MIGPRERATGAGVPVGRAICPGTRAADLYCRVRPWVETELVKTRVAILVAALAGTVLAIVACWCFARPEQAAISRELGGVVGHPLDPFVGLSWLLTGAVLAWLRPRNALGWLLVSVGGLQVLQTAGAGYGSLGVHAAPDWPASRWVAWSIAGMWIPGLLPLGSLLVALYPDGRLPGPRWRLPVAAALAGTAGLMVAAMLSQPVYNSVAAGPSPLAWNDSPGWLSIGLTALAGLLVLGGTLAIWVMSAVRLVHLRAPARQQLAWLLAVIAVVFIISPLTSPPAWLEYLALGLVPVAVGMGVFRYNLLGIEFVLRRGLVYGLLTAGVLAVYLLVTALAGSRLGRGPIPGTIAAAVIAIGLTPVRDYVQRGVDRLVYGERRDPIRVVARVGDQVVTAEENDLLAGVLASITHAVRAPGACVVGPDGHLLARVGEPGGDGPNVPLVVSGRAVGTLHLAEHKHTEPYGASQLRMLEVLAPQTAVVVRALELAQRLQQERDLVVTATRSERERLRRDLHDGLGPSLSGVGLGLVGVTDALAHGDEGSARTLVSRLQAEVTTAVAEVRRIIDDLRPAGLEDQGLTAALHRHVALAGLPVELTVSSLPPLRPELEAGAYRITTEAITNVRKHALASRARVCVMVHGDALVLEVADDGRGLGVPASPTRLGGGVGLDSMRHRAEALGGQLRIASGDHGTTVSATLPLERP